MANNSCLIIDQNFKFTQCPPPNSKIACFLKTVCAYDKHYKQIASFDSTCSACAQKNVRYFQDGQCAECIKPPRNNQVFQCPVPVCDLNKNPRPVCAIVYCPVQQPCTDEECIMHPCDPIQENFQSAQQACANPNVRDYKFGAC